MTVVGVDIGGTTTEAVRLDPSGVVLATAVVATQPGDAVVASTIDAIAAVQGDAPLERLGVGVPGQVDVDSGVVHHAVNLGIGRRGVDLGADLAAALGVPVFVENDVRAAALGAYRHLPGAAVDTLVLLGIGTGVSAGIVLGGRIHRGRDGLAGEVGHVVLDPAGPVCACGLSGCLEVLVAGPAIARRWAQGDGAAAAALFEGNAVGDPAAVPLARDVAGHLATAVHWLMMTYGADLVVLGGGVGAIGEPLRAAVQGRLEDLTSRSELAARVLASDRVVTAPAELPLGALGAAELSRDHAVGQSPAVPRSTGHNDLEPSSRVLPGEEREGWEGT